MEDPHFNRQASPRRRGPQPGQQTTPLPEPAEVVDIPQPPLTGIRCPACGRAMMPRRDRVESAAKCYASCTLCGARLVLTYTDGRPATVRVVR